MLRTGKHSLKLRTNDDVETTMASDEYTTNTSRTKQIHFADAGRKKLLITDDVKELLSVRTNGVDITDITLGNSVTAIQDNCFRGFQNLRSVNGGSNCKYIGENAFRDCTNLSSCDMVGNAGTTMSFIG